MAAMIEIAGFPAHFDESDARRLCEQFGHVANVHFESSRNGALRLAYVEFLDDWEAQDACTDLDGLLVDKRFLEVQLIRSSFFDVG